MTKEFLQKFYGDKKEDLDNKEWFNNLEPYVQKIVKKYYDNIRNKSTMIPTQLRNILPGFRNMYCKEVYWRAPNGTERLVFKAYHSGTTGHDFKVQKIAQQATDESFKAQAAALEVRKDDLRIISFLSPRPKYLGGGKDTKIFNQLENATTKRTILMPQNLFRYLLSHREDSAKAFTQNVANYFRSYSENKDDWILNEVLQKYQKLNSFFYFLTDPFDRNNRNLQRAVCLKLMASLIETHPNHENKELPKTKFVSQCMSGKDREGVVEFCAVAEAMTCALLKESI